MDRYDAAEKSGRRKSFLSRGAGYGRSDSESEESVEVVPELS